MKQNKSEVEDGERNKNVPISILRNKRRKKIRIEEIKEQKRKSKSCFDQDK